MDPYLEHVWPDVHHRLTFLASDAIQSQLADDLVARSESHVYVTAPSGDDVEIVRTFRPDAHVVEAAGRSGGGVALAEPAASAEPLVFEFKAEPTRQRFLEIIDPRAGGRVVTVIEFTSPANKRGGPGSEAYIRKQDECRDASVNLVEVDLTRAGERRLLVNQWPQARRHASAFAVSAWRAAEPQRCALHAIRLADRLPTIGIPLRVGERDVTLDLQSLVDRAYASGRYDKVIDYAKPPEPALSPDEAAWATALIASTATSP